MHWKLVIAALTLGVLAGCTREKDEVSQLGVSRSQRVLLHVPAAYKIVNETLTLLVLRAGQVRVAIHRIDQNNFRIVKASKTQMAANVRTTQFGDIVVPATGFQVGETSGWKFAILDKDTRRPKLVEYLLTVNGGHVRVTIDSDKFQPFDEVPVEAMLGTITVGTGEPLGGAYHEMFGRKREYDLTKSPARLRVLADNHQFLIYDFDTNPFEPFPEINERTSRQGWTRNDHGLWIFTKAAYNDHRIDVCISDHFDPDRAAIRQTVHNLRLPTGTLALFEHPNHVKFRVPPGDYMIYCRAYNLGNEGEAMVDLPDDEFFNHDEWERYELILVPGVAKREGQL
jgi:hypothetical protein